MTHPDPIGRIPPHSEENEKALLGALLHDGLARGEMLTKVAPTLRPQHFYSTAHRRLFEVMLELHERGEPADPQLVLRECERRGVLGAIGGRGYLVELANGVQSWDNAEQYAAIVRERALARDALYVVEKARAAVLEGADGNDVAEGLEQAVARLSEGREPAQVYGSQALAQEIRAEWDTPPEDAPGVPCGLQDLDAITGGFREGQLVVVAGRPSMGKTTLAVNFVRHAGVERRVPVLFVTLEVSRREVIRNLLSSISGVETTRLHDPRRIRHADQDVLEAARQRLRDSPLLVCDDARVTLPALRAIARRARARDGVRLVVIDYLQLLSVWGLAGLNRSSTREQEVSSISRALKGLAREMGVAVVALSQLNRGPENREDHRPRLSDLRESGALEADADVVLLLHRESYYAKSQTARDATRGVAEILVAKNRNGPTDVVRIAYQDSCARFGNLATVPSGRG